jgi:uncharacterized protein (TIGR00251 family)
MTADKALPFIAESAGIRLVVRLTPKGGRDAVDGVVTTADDRSALAIRVAAPPFESAANEALIAFLAKALKLRKRDITIRSGETSRIKVLHLDGDAAQLLGRLNALIPSR